MRMSADNSLSTRLTSREATFLNQPGVERMRAVRATRKAGFASEVYN